MELPRNQDEVIWADTTTIPWTCRLGGRCGLVDRQRTTLFSAILPLMSPDKIFKSYWSQAGEMAQ